MKKKEKKNFETFALFTNGDPEPTFLVLHKQFSEKEFEECELSLMDKNSDWVIVNHHLLPPYHNKAEKKVFWYSYN